LLAFKNAVVLQHLQLSLLAILLLDLFYYVIVVVIIVRWLRGVFEAILSNSESGLLDD
jgi:hypothetical protein